jgi:hypothetical protein
MKIFNPIFKMLLVVMLVIGCQPEDINVNTGPLFLESFTADGTSSNTGQPVSKPIAQNESKIPLDAVITVDFSKNIDPESLSAVSLELQDGTVIASSVTADDDKVIIDPNNNLEFGTKYNIVISPELRAEDGGMFLDGLTRTFNSESAVPTVYEGRIFHMGFNDNFTEEESGTNATVVGSPTFSTDAVAAKSYDGTTGAYLTFPTAGLLGQEFTATFWMKVNATPDRAGILVIGPPDPVNPATPNNRNHGFRFFREAAGAKQRFKLNVGTGTSDSWFDGGAAADVDPTLNKWVHFAFTISATEARVYINGQIVSQGALTGGVSWSGCDIMSIMSGMPRFTEWGHLSDGSLMDELNIFSKALTQGEIQAIRTAEGGYGPKYAGETFYMPFEGSNKDLVSGTDATVVGTPTFAGQAKLGQDAYAGAANSYLTFPTTGLTGTEFSAAFWLNINAAPDRAGILTASAPDVANPSNPNNRNFGFRFFREAAGAKQRFKLNVGNGTADSWFDGGAAADVDPATTDWVHFAFTISAANTVVYINGAPVSQGPLAGGISWTGVDIISIMSGDPRFMEWGHHSDLSFMDELRFFNKALSQAEVQAIMNE